MSALANGAKSLFVLYLMISGNYLGSLFGCRVQRLFENNMAVKHALGFFTLYFFISLIEGTKQHGPVRKLAETGAIYAAFIMSTKMNLRFWVPFVVIMSLVYVLFIAKDTLYDTDKQDERLDDIKKVVTEARITKAQRWLVLAALLVLVSGFVVYMGEKKLEYGPSFDYVRFIFGNPVCKGETPTTLKDIPVADKVRAAFTPVGGMLPP